MKNSRKLLIGAAFIFAISGCNKMIDLYPISNLSSVAYYTNLTEINSALTGCYSSLQKIMLDEWQLTELRSDNTQMGNSGSGSTPNRDLSDLDMFMPSTSAPSVYNYWINNYYNIRNINLVQNSVGANYTAETGTITFADSKLADSSRKRISSEASFLRAYQYFNLVRLYGGVFLIHEPLDAEAAKKINRSDASEIYKLIIADLQNAIQNGSSAKFASIPAASLGRSNSWVAKALLAKVYLTLNKKAEAITLLNDVIANSGYKLQTNYADVFSTSNEMNSEILFAVRYKSGGIALGSTFANLFAPLQSGSAVVNGDGSGLNTPSANLNAQYTATDLRKAVTIGTFGTGTKAVIYAKKHVSAVTIVNDSESDWTEFRFSDVLLMLAEAQGNSASSIALINQTRLRAGLVALTTAAINTTALFESALATERRLEFALENQRWYDMLRFNTTMTTVKAETTLKDNLTFMYPLHYGLYPAPRLTLLELQALVTTNKLLLPIPQREIDNNTALTIPQNPGY